MPYTREQLNALSALYRDGSFTIETVMGTLQEIEAECRGLFDEWSGELIVGEPFIVHEYEQWSWRTRRSIPRNPHHYACRENAERDGWRLCDSCNNWVHPSHTPEATVIEENIYCCGDCACDCGWRTCEYCGEWVHEDDEVWTGEHTYCCDGCAENDGWSQCERCGEWARDTWDVIRDSHTELWCENCIDNSAMVCDECGERFHENDVVWDRIDNRYLCNDCSGEERQPRRRSRHVLHDYGWAPSLSFYDEGGKWEGGEKTPLFLGVELETDGGSGQLEYAGALADVEGFEKHFWMTRDGSLCDGVEITSHPMTLAAHVGLRELYDEIGGTAARFGYKSHDGGRCGLHVHVNRSWFGKDKRLQDAGGYKLMRLMQRFEQAFTILSRRVNNRWCGYRTSGDYKLKDEVKTRREGKDEAGPIQIAQRMECNEKGHAQCVNFEHRDTFEVRIFRGTLKWTTYFASLGLVNGLCHTVRNHGSIWVESVSWYDLVDEVIERCDEPFARECLAEYIAEKGLR